jgi:hypothetical protein
LLTARCLGLASCPAWSNAFSSKKKPTELALSRKYWSVLEVWLRVLKTEMVAGSNPSSCRQRRRGEHGEGGA